MARRKAQTYGSAISRETTAGLSARQSRRLRHRALLFPLKAGSNSV